MAGFGQKHRREPVILKKSTDKRMGHVMPGHVLAVLDTNYLAVGTRIDERLHRAINRRQPHLMTNDEDIFVILCRIVHSNEVFRVGAERFFNQNMPSELHGPGHEIETMVFERGNHDPIDLIGRVLKKLLSGSEAPLSGNAMGGGKGLALR